MKRELPPQYNPKEHEERIYRMWEESGFFNPDRLPVKKSAKPYTVMLPPPNVTGTLHMGHALNAAIQDILIRKKRMEGFRTLWVPGTDHAGIATQNVVEKQLKKEGVTRHDLGREKFLEKVWEWKEKYGNTILAQLKSIGASCDWTRTRFTMDPGYQKAVEEAFRYYHRKGWIYQGERVISWCSRCRTSLSDLELEYKEEPGKLWYIRYPFADGAGSITVATTRPETMLGDAAVAVHPKDARYRDAVGKTVRLPIAEREIPVIEDRRIEKEFGSGAVKVTPAHDMLDEAIGLDHRLPAPKIIGENGRMTKDAGAEFEGLPVFEARGRVVQKLEERGLIEKIEDHVRSVAHCYRCDMTIEPLRSRQWFLKMEELAGHALAAVQSGRVRFHPKRWERVYAAWLKNIRDWTISRQIWWGHTIPIEGSADVLDTWFSSALWPFATLGWPEKTRDLKTFYPTQVLSTARDIINLWVARMVFSGRELAGADPFRDVIIHATILTKDGKRMSKSLGTGIDPMDLIGRYGADATRFGLIWQAMGGQDIHWSEEHVAAGRKFCNKIWNSARFVFMQLGSSAALAARPPKAKTPADRALLGAFSKTVKIVDTMIERYEFGKALHALYDFYWHAFCDAYIEASKKQCADPKLAKNTEAILLFVLANSLKTLHPFMPFVTEAIWENLPRKTKQPLVIEQWPRS